MLKEKVESAAKRIGQYIHRTDCIQSPYYSEKTGANVFLKLENLQHTGSFKARGALNKVLSLQDSDREKGVVTASTGNHGAAVAYAASIVGTTARVFVSETASQNKVEAIRRLGADVITFGNDPVEAENEARRYADSGGFVFVSPYNDIEVVAGQGTIGSEIADQVRGIDAVYVAVGGGGLISGIGGYLKSVSPETEIVGCSPENSKVMIQSVELGELHGDLPSKPTLSDGTAGGIEDGSITFDLCRKYVDRYVSVEEDEIAKCLKEFLDVHHMLIEGAAAVPIAALYREGKDLAAKNVVLVICGANIGTEKLREVLSAER
ncbi:MAG: threonine/serine dehydratase [Pyrinomonadaceae bacterium]|nr:threonine/serine dehydratase [Pyrinomonadaceae bacterium]